MDGEHVQAVKQILTEAPLRYGCVQIAVRGRQHTYVDRDRPVPPDAFKRALLEHSQEHDLCFRWQLADFIQKERSTVGRFEAPDSPLNGASEGALLMAEELRRDQRGWNRRAVDADERATRALRAVVNRPRD